MDKEIESLGYIPDCLDEIIDYYTEAEDTILSLHNSTHSSLMIL